MGVRLVFFFHPVNNHLEAILMSIDLLSMALNAALRAATQSISAKEFSRKTRSNITGHEKRRDR